MTETKDITVIIPLCNEEGYAIPFKLYHNAISKVFSMMRLQLIHEPLTKDLDIGYELNNYYFQLRFYEDVSEDKLEAITSHLVNNLKLNLSKEPGFNEDVKVLLANNF